MNKCIQTPVSRYFFLSLLFFHSLPLPSVCLHLLLKTFYHPPPSDASFPSPPLSAFSSHNWVIVFTLHGTGSWISQNVCLKTKPSSCARTQTLMAHESTHMQRRLTSLFWNVKTWQHIPHPHTRTRDELTGRIWGLGFTGTLWAFELFSPFKGYTGADDVSSYWQLLLHAQTQHLNILSAHWWNQVIHMIQTFIKLNKERNATFNFSTRIFF